uniref:1-acylglycerol-3-phosphate O-acyltransferase n=1 Tax=Equus caballus TaxID=9796 RepID=A0A9L0T1M9_HORSE
MDLVGLLKSQFLCHLVFCYVFIASGLIINTIQLFTLILWPINKQLFRKINCRLSYCISSQLVMLLEWWSGTECIIHTDPRAYPKYGKENAIVVLNHKFEIDFLCGWSLAERFGVLGLDFLYAFGTRSLCLTFVVFNTSRCVRAEPVSGLQSPGQEGAGLRAHHWLDVVLHRDGLLHAQVGAGPQDRRQEPAAPPGLPREVLFPDSLRGHPVHGEEAPDQHAGGPCQGAAQPQVPPAAAHQGLCHHREEFEKCR